MLDMPGASHERDHRLKVHLRFIAALALLGACGAEAPAPTDAGFDAGAPRDAMVAPDAAAPDAQPPLTEGAPVQAVQVPLGPSSGRVVLTEQGALVRRAGDAWWIGTATATRLGPVAPITGGTSLGDGSALVLTEGGAQIATGTRLLDSQLADALEGAQPRRVVRAPDNTLWLATAQSLHVYSGGEGRRLTPTGLPTEAAELAFGPRVGGRAQLWVASRGRVYALDTAAATLEPQAPESVEQLAADPSGRLWVRAGGRLYLRGPGGDWRAQSIEVRAVGAGWIARSEGLAWADGDVLRPIEGLAADAELVATDARSAVVRVGGELVQVYPGRALVVVGLESDAVLTASTTLAAYGANVSLRLDGVALPTTEFRGGVRAVLPVPALTPGPHLLVAEGGGMTQEVPFRAVGGGPPTWAGDIEPLFRARCAACHGTGGNAHALDTPARWQAEIDKILLEVRARRMPLPPYRFVTASEIERIEGWKSSGFRE